VEKLANWKYKTQPKFSRGRLSTNPSIPLKEMTQILPHIPRDQIPIVVLQNQELNSHFDLENNSDWDNKTQLLFQGTDFNL
jgi:hypothetical protein